MFRSRQEIPAHPSGTGIFYILEGKGVMYLDDEEISLSKGTVVIAPEGSKGASREWKDWLPSPFTLVERIKWRV